jgi:outer membrane protein
LKICPFIFNLEIKRILFAWIILTLLCLFLNGTVFSGVDTEPVNNGKPFTLTDCVNIALENSPIILRARQKLDPTHLSLIDSWAAFAPSVDFSSGYKVTQKRHSAYWRDHFNRDYYDASVSVSQTLYDNGIRFQEVKKARLNWLKESQEYLQTRNDLILTVTQSYLTLLKAQTMVETEEEFCEKAQSLLELVKSKHKLGYAPESDVRKSEVEVTRAKVGLIDAKNDVEIAQAELCTLLGLDVREPIDIEKIREPVEIKGTPEEFLEEAQNNRLKIKIMEKKLEMDKIDISLAARKLWPQTKLSGDFSLPLEKKYPTTRRTWQAGVGLSYPLFDAGANYRRYKKTKLQLGQSENDFEEVKQDIALEVTRTYFELMRQKRVREVTKLQTSLALDSLNDSRNRYDLGFASIREVIEARTLYRDAKIREVRAFYDLLLAQAQLYKVLDRNIYEETTED